ncbi:MAG: beta-glucosidase, partial [Treponema sp.]|nr:beta-glucosidase [Candidatus Treponema equi]
ASLVAFEDDDCIEFTETAVVEQLTSAAAPVESFDRIRNNGGKIAMEKVPLRKYDLKKRIEDSIPAEIPYTGDKGIKFLDVKADPSKLDDFIAQLDDTMLMTLCRGEGMMSRKTVPGLASAMGGLSEDLYQFGIPVAGCADGPSGIRMDTGTEANLMPIGTLLACSWNLDLVRELMEFEGDELVENKIDTCLGPGINIQRNPLCGRNFEYFSEDPLLTGAMTCTILDGIQSRGVWPTIKHFACNNRENGRRMNNAIVSERALREIYLAPFEMAVKKGCAKSIMSSYNLINGVQAASNYELCQTILRDDWKYEGLVMTDWWATCNDCAEGGDSDVEQVSQMIRSRNDVYMICQNDKAELDGNGDDLRDSLKSGKIKRSELQRCARDVVAFMINTRVAERPLRGLNDVPGFVSKLEKQPEGQLAYGEDIKFMKDGTTKAYIEVPEDDVYNFLAMFRKENDGTVSQSVCNLNFDGENALSLNCRTTEGKHEGAIMGLLKLTKGVYELELVHTKPGIEIDYVGFSRRITTSTGMKFFRDYGEAPIEHPRFGRKKKADK